ncbi:hypothetical protein [Methylotenera sp. L2L1]|jgi:hypothetical protein|uniref:hypothetical protein n=1 Tax=Methylotenera sp. L2L1 TaxID=1502770 RepID=UPI00055CE6DC|nr:hypothetical protein [Methylotenera sp. L2L1]
MKISIKFLLVVLAMTFTLPAYASDFTPLIVFFFVLAIVVFLITFIPIYKFTSRMPNQWPKQLIRSLAFSIFWAPFPTEGYQNWWPACIAVFDFSLLPKAIIAAVIVTIILFFLIRIPAIDYDNKNA